jgi:hypothetical protein
MNKNLYINWFLFIFKMCFNNIRGTPSHLSESPALSIGPNRVGILPEDGGRIRSPKRCFK